MSRIISLIITVATLVGMAVLAFVMVQILKPEPEQAEEKFAGLSVFSENVTQTNLDFNVTAQGEVRPRREIIVAPQIAGRIAFVSPDFIDGGFIRRGQVLVRLETADYQLAVVRAQSGVASAEQRLAREQAEAEIARQDLIDLGITDSSPLARREPQLAEAEAALESAKAQLADAELALSRTAVVAPQHAGPRRTSSCADPDAGTGDPGRRSLSALRVADAGLSRAADLWWTGLRRAAAPAKARCAGRGWHARSHR